jgi:predicted phosphoribosyltransferase
MSHGNHVHYRDRAHAGQALAGVLAAYRGRPELVILAIPKSAVPIAHEVAQALQAPLDVFLVHRVGSPERPLVPLGAVTSGAMRVFDKQVLRDLRLSMEVLEPAVQAEIREISRRELVYRGATEPLPLRGKTCILVDDGLASALAMREAAEGLRHHHPHEVVLAFPIAARENVQALEGEGLAVVCPQRPEGFHEVRQWYQHFEQPSDAEVLRLLRATRGFGAESGAQPGA